MCRDSEWHGGRPRRPVSGAGGDPLAAPVLSESVPWRPPEDGLCLLLCHPELSTVLYEPRWGVTGFAGGALSPHRSVCPEVPLRMWVCVCLRGQQGAEGLQVPGNGTQEVGFGLLLALEDLRVEGAGSWHSQQLAQTAMLRWTGLTHGVKGSIMETGHAGSIGEALLWSWTMAP